MFEVACFTSIHLPRLLLQSSGQVNSSKSMIGHCLGAAAGVEVGFAGKSGELCCGH